jgi:glucose-1-phosphate cytidylyltransferase
MTGGRLKRVAPYIGNETFMVTYGDGVSNLNISELAAYHRKHGKAATVTATQPSGRFGALSLDEGDRVQSFQEKPAGDGSWINGGFFVLEPDMLGQIAGDSTIFEREPLERLARDGQLIAYKHDGFWHAMDTLRDKIHLEALWEAGTAPWKVW